VSDFWSPGNLLRTTDGKLCILDFGLVTPITQDQQYSIIEYIAHLISENYEAVPSDLVSDAATNQEPMFQGKGFKGFRV
jgi:predicted unusual protein kinase regulating ubiquinone biosynthesis (AarF/ABC1/UbiB family)